MISDILWHEGIRDVQDLAFFLDVLSSCFDSCRGLSVWLRSGE